eukprot:CAMPEP_0197038070 /NCGR_PEP_ID=MMETSP1384-20130603/15104_1 /TAXON_ID=29189 /ORGANISM="Ammonia sp." /LENGTH=328 /DNA_ID=CAMNT_0042468463 /DNA_START=91 /DNA_END=1077 /DNA_ORIENTATION=+
MARPAVQDPTKTEVLIEALKDYGIPIGRLMQMVRAYERAADYVLDVQSFIDNYDRFQKLCEISQSLNIDFVQDLANEQLQELVDKLNESSYWSFLSSTLPEGAAQCSADDLEKKEALEVQVKQLQDFKQKWSATFTSKEAMQQKADELLSRNRIFRLIEMAMVFKDVCLGINRAIQTNKKLRHHQQELQRINEQYVEPTIQSFLEKGAFDDGVVETALMQLRYIRTQCEIEQKETSQSWFGHMANFVSMGFQAYASFTSASALSEVATKTLVNQTYLIGGVQGTLAVGSLVLSGVEAYNYIQYKNIIDECKRLTSKLEYYRQEVQRRQ